MKQFFAVISFFLLYAVNSFSRNSVDTIPFRTTVSNPQTIYQAWNLRGINSFLLPIKDTLNHPATPYAGSLTIRPQDVALGLPIVYITNGTRWDVLVATVQGSVADTLFVADDLYVAFDEEGRQILRRRRSEAIVTTVAGLRSLDTAYTNILYETIDYGGGLWNFKEDSVNADNTGLVIKLASQDSGRMFRQYSGSKDARWFGAISDGTFTLPSTVTGTDNQTALQTWLNTGGALYLPAGIFRHNDRLEINQEETEIEGDGENLSQLLYGGSDFDDQLIIADSAHNRGIKLKKIRLTGGGRARYNWWSYTFNRSCEITDCKFRDALGVIKIEHGYYSNIDRNLFGPTIADPMAAGITREQWKQVWQSGGVYTAPVYFAEMNGSSISGNKIAGVQTRPYGDTSVPAMTVYLYGEGLNFNANLLESMSFDTTHQATVMLWIANNSSVNIHGIYFEVIGSDYTIFSDGKTFIDIKGLQAYQVRGNTMFYNRSFGKFKVSNSTGHRLKFQRLKENLNSYSSEQDIVFDNCQFVQGERLTDSTITPYAYNLFDTDNTGWPYGMTDGISVYTDLHKKRFLKVISGYALAYGSDANGAYVQIDCGTAILEDGSPVSLNFYVDGNAITSGEKIKMKLRPNVANRFYRVHINRAGGLFLIENASAFSHAKGDWIASFETDGAGAIINTAANPRLSQNGAYLQNSDLIYSTGVDSPEGVVPATIGSFYTRTDATANAKFFVKATGVATSSAGWVSMQDSIIVTTTGTSGASTKVGNTINIPQYSGGGGGAATSIESNVSVSADNSWDIGNSTNALKNVYSYNITSKGAALRFQTSLSSSAFIWTQNVTDVARLYGTTGNFVISPQGSPADVSSAAFQVISTTKGAISAPKMTTAQRDAVSSPVAGLHVYNTTTNKINYHNGTAWTEVADAGGGGGAWGSITGTLSDQTDLQAALLAKVDTSDAIKFTLSSLRDNDLLKYDSLNARWINFRTTFLPPLSWNYSTGTASADTTTLATRAYVLNNSGAGSVTEVNGTANRITSTGGTTPAVDISSTFEALLGKVASPLSQFAATTSAQLAGNISDETGTGALTFGTAPTFTTNLTTPLVIGGTGTTSDLFFKTTTGVGASGADMHFLTGTDGSTEAVTILNNGLMGINIANPSTYLDVNSPSGSNGIINIRTTTPASATSAGITFQARGVVAWDGTHTGMKIATSDNGKPVVFGNSTTAGAGEYARFSGAGLLSLGIGSAPSALLHIKASTATASTGQIKLAEGTRQTTAEDGTINYIANNLEFVETSTVYTLAKTLTATATLDFPSTATGIAADLTITVTGAALGDAVSIGVPNGSITATGIFYGWVSATNTVTIRFIPHATEDPASGTFRAAVIKY